MPHFERRRRRRLGTCQEKHFRQIDRLSRSALTENGSNSLSVLNLFSIAPFRLSVRLSLSLSPIGALCQVVYSQIKLGQGGLGRSVPETRKPTKAPSRRQRRTRTHNKASLILMNSFPLLLLLPSKRHSCPVAKCTGVLGLGVCMLNNKHRFSLYLTRETP